MTRTGSTAAGTSSTFTAHSSMADIVDYVATLNSDEARNRFSAGRQRQGHLQLQDDRDRPQGYVNVVARNAAGVQTERGAQVWTTTDEPQVSSVEFPENGSGRLATGTFTFSSYLPDTVGYHYSMNSGSYVTVPARADGTAQVTWTPTAEGAHRLRVFRIKADTHWSRTFKDHLFAVANAVTTVASVAPGTVPSGDLRTITIHGTQLHQDDKVEVSPYRTVPIRAWVKTVSPDRRTLTAEVDLSHAVLGPATLTLHPYGTLKPVVLANAFTIGPPPALQSVKPPPSAERWRPVAPSRWTRANGRPARSATGTSGRRTASRSGTRTTRRSRSLWRWSGSG